MRAIEPTLTKKLELHTRTRSVAKAPPFRVNSYRALVEHVARLAYLNKDSLLFFRGQPQDFLNKAGATTLYPTIYREDNLSRREVGYRFERLEQAALQLKDLFSRSKVEGHSDVSRKRYIQWSILQHYGVCSTPLLDLTHSLRVACSFAQHDRAGSNVFVYVLGLPYFTNRISINSEHDIVNVRLLSICPPDALRPYFQEGYLAGTPDVSTDYDSKSELDFNNRLIAKFAIPNTKKFWGTGLSKIPEAMLYPKSDRIHELCQEIRNVVLTGMHPGDLGEFISEWAELEQFLMQRAQSEQSRTLTIREAIQGLYKAGVLNERQMLQIDEMRKLRNVLVHEPKRADPNSIRAQLGELKQLRHALT